MFFFVENEFSALYIGRSYGARDLNSFWQKMNSQLDKSVAPTELGMGMFIFAKQRMNSLLLKSVAPMELGFKFFLAENEFPALYIGRSYGAGALNSFWQRMNSQLYKSVALTELGL